MVTVDISDDRNSLPSAEMRVVRIPQLYPKQETPNRSGGPIGKYAMTKRSN
jgi:hypothetical protein